MLPLVSACQGNQVKNVRFYAEIPFPDCPEGVFMESVTHKSGLISCEDWKKIRPFMTMIDPKGKEEIFNGWAEACRYAVHDGGQCNQKMESARDTIMGLDAIAGSMLKDMP